MGNYKNKNYSEADLQVAAWVLRLMFYPMLMIAIIFFTIGIITHLDSENMKEFCTERVTATVTDSIKSERTSRRANSNIRRTTYTYAPVYSYTYNGKEYSVESNNSTRPARYSVGDKAVIMVNPDNPAEIYEPAFKETSMNSIIFMIVGVCGLLGCIGTVVFRAHLNKKAKQKHY